MMFKRRRKGDGRFMIVGVRSIFIIDENTKTTTKNMKQLSKQSNLLSRNPVKGAECLKQHLLPTTDGSSERSNYLPSPG